MHVHVAEIQSWLPSEEIYFHPGKFRHSVNSHSELSVVQAISKYCDMSNPDQWWPGGNLFDDTSLAQSLNYER